MVTGRLTPAPGRHIAQRAGSQPYLAAGNRPAGAAAAVTTVEIIEFVVDLAVASAV